MTVEHTRLRTTSMTKDADNPKSRKLPQKKAPFHRATPSLNVVFLGNGVVNHRAPFSRQLPAHIASSTPPMTVVPNAGAHAIGHRHQISGFPTSSLRSTFTTASPFVQNTFPPADAPSRVQTPEAYIQPASTASSAIPEPTVFSWHMEDDEDVALGYERLKGSRKAAKVHGECGYGSEFFFISPQTQAVEIPVLLPFKITLPLSRPPLAPWIIVTYPHTTARALRCRFHRIHECFAGVRHDQSQRVPHKTRERTLPGHRFTSVKQKPRPTRTCPP